MRRITTLYQSRLVGSDSFEISPPKGHRVIGLLMSSYVEVSLAFNGGNDLKLYRYRADYTPQGAPDDRVISFDEPLEGTIKGVVNTFLSYSNREDYPQTSIYLISEPYES